MLSGTYFASLLNELYDTEQNYKVLSELFIEDETSYRKISQLIDVSYYCLIYPGLSRYLR